MPIFKKKNDNFFSTWASDMAYVLGFFAADGYMIRNKRGAHFVDFYSNDREILEKIRKSINSDHKLTVRKRLDGDTSYKLQIGSRRWFDDLTKLGFKQNKSKIIRLPKIPDNYIGDFLRGYFDGDGCISYGKYWRKDINKWQWKMTTMFTSGSRLFLEELLHRIKKYVAGGHIRSKDRAFDLAFSINDSLAIFRLMYHNIKSDLLLLRKYNKFNEAFKNLNLRA